MSNQLDLFAIEDPYHVNEHGVFVNPERIVIEHTKTLFMEVRVAMDDAGLWHWGWSYTNKKNLSGGGGLPSLDGRDCKTRLEAIAEATNFLQRCR